MSAKDQSSFEDAEYTAEMTIAEDWKSFTVTIHSDLKMNSDDVILALEDWLYSNLLEGYRRGCVSLQ